MRVGVSGVGVSGVGVSEVGVSAVGVGVRGGGGECEWVRVRVGVNWVGGCEWGGWVYYNRITMNMPGRT